MGKLTLEKLLCSVDDKDLLNMHEELESGEIPNTSYCHDFCRKVNHMVDRGELCVKAGSYRHMYMPTISRAVYKEMARRYSEYLHNYKGPEASDADIAFDEEEEECTCEWCNGTFGVSELVKTDLGMLCEGCIMAIRSRGEDVAILR